MKNIRKRITAGILVILMLFMAGCQAKKDYKGNVQTEYDDYIEEIIGKFVDTENFLVQFQFINPQNAGLEKKAQRVVVGSKAIAGKELRDAKEILEKLKSFDVNKLDKESATQLETMIDILEPTIKVADMDYFYFNNDNFNSVDGLHVNLPLYLAEYRIENSVDLENYFNILESAHQAFVQLIVIEKERQEKGVGMSKVAINKVIDQCNAFIGDGRPFTIEVANKKIDELTDLSEEKKTTFKLRNEQLNTKNLVAGYKELKYEFSQMKAREEHLGLSHFSKGKEYYSDLLQLKTGLNITPEEAKNMLMDEYFALVMDMQNNKTELEKSGKKISDYENIKNNVSEFSSVKENVEFLKEESAKDYPDIGTLNFRTTQVPKELEKSSAPAFYFRAPMDASQSYENSIWINGDFKTRDYFTVAHEGVPGHMYHDSYFIRKKTPYTFQVLNRSVAGIWEGWAVYSEHRALDYVPGDKVVAKLIQNESDVSLMMMSLADVGIHYEGWNLEQLTAFFNNELKLPYSKEQLKPLYERIVETPANYNSYSLSYLKYKGIYERAKKAQGDNFNLKEYHKVILDASPCRLDLLETRMNEYINESGTENKETNKKAA